MEAALKKKLAIATAAYWFLLLYIVAALIWWFISLEKQNTAMAQLQLQALHEKFPNGFDEAPVQNAVKLLRDEEKRNTAKYIGEGSTFLALILVGAVFVYRAVRRQIKLQQQQQNFMMAVTHELKTPIAVAKLNLETLQKHQLEVDRQRKMLQMTLSEINRLNGLTNNILVSSQLESGRYKKAREELDFSTLVSSCLQDYKSRFPDRIWIADIEPELDMAGDTLLLQILVNNLLENAEKYAPKDKPITCRLQRHKSRIRLEVIDEGPGIAGAEKKKVFEKFYRIGNESTRRAKGTGLGLYLCQKIVSDHSGQIQLLDNRPSGCNFTVEFKA